MATIKPGTYTTDELLKALLPDRLYNYLNDNADYTGKVPEFINYAFPGGYDIGYIDADNCILCADCATKQIVSQLEEIAECFADDREYYDTFDSFRIVDASCSADWEGNELCEGCNKSLGPDIEGE